MPESRPAIESCSGSFYIASDDGNRTVGRNAAKAKLMEMMEVYGSVGKAWIPEFNGLPKEETTMDEKKS